MLLYLPVSGFRLHFFQIKGKANGKCFALLYLHLAEREHHKKVKCLHSCFPHYSAFSHHSTGKPNPQQIVPKADPSAAQILSFQIYRTGVCADETSSSQAWRQTYVYCTAGQAEQCSPGIQGFPLKVLGPTACKL